MCSKKDIENSLSQYAYYNRKRYMTFDTLVVKAIKVAIDRYKVEIDGSYYFCSTLGNLGREIGYCKNYISFGLRFLTLKGYLRTTGSRINRSPVYLVDESKWGVD